MALRRLQQDWDELGNADPMWAVLTYDKKDHGRWQPEEFFATGEVEIAELFQHLDRAGIDVKRDQALDFGCGLGRLTQPLARRFNRVTGVDIAPSMVAGARTYNAHPDRCQYLVNATDGLRRFPSESFDFVNSCITLQHMHPRHSRKYIAEFVRLLREDGIAVFQIPDEPAGTLNQRSKYLVKYLFPDSALMLYRRIRFRTGRVPMEMFGLRVAEVSRIVQMNAGSIVDMRVDVGRDLDGGKQGYPTLGKHLDSVGWVSVQYVVRKRGRTEDLA